MFIPAWLIVVVILCIPGAVEAIVETLTVLVLMAVGVGVFMAGVGLVYFVCHGGLSVW